MIEIYRSSNTPIVINLNTDMETIDEIEISIYSDNNSSSLAYTWNKETIIIKDGLLYLPFTQAESSSLPVGIGHLEIKWLTTDGKIMFAKPESIKIKTPNNLSVLGKDEKIIEPIVPGVIPDI